MVYTKGRSVVPQSVLDDYKCPASVSGYSVRPPFIEDPVSRRIVSREAADGVLATVDLSKQDLRYDAINLDYKSEKQGDLCKRAVVARTPIPGVYAGGDSPALGC